MTAAVLARTHPRTDDTTKVSFRKFSVFSAGIVERYTSTGVAVSFPVKKNAKFLKVVAMITAVVDRAASKRDDTTNENFAMLMCVGFLNRLLNLILKKLSLSTYTER